MIVAESLNCGDDVVKMSAAYRKVALEKHPDKAGAAIAAAAQKFKIEEEFKGIQEAYETLSDPARRREFDSTDTFDDSLPSDCAPEDFFKVLLLRSASLHYGENTPCNVEAMAVKIISATIFAIPEAASV